MENNIERKKDQPADELLSLRSHMKRIRERTILLFEQNLAFSVVIDSDGKIENVNKTFLTNLNYSKDEVLGQLLISFIVETQKKDFLAQFIKGFEGEHTLQLEVGIYAKDRSIKTILFSSTQLLFQEEGTPDSILVSGVDITARKKAEEKLKKLQEDTRREGQRLEEVLSIDQKISSILNLNHLIDFIIEKATGILDAKRCSMMFLDVAS